MPGQLPVAALAALSGAVVIHQLPAPITAGVAILVFAGAYLLSVTLSSCWPLWFALGLVWTSYRVDLRLSETLTSELVGQDVWVEGWVDAFPRPAAGQVSFSLRTAEHGPPAGVPARLRLTWYDPPFTLEAGVSLRALVRLKRPRGLSNPGGFDYERWLFTENYRATGYVRKGERSRDLPASPARAWLRLRAELAREIASATPGPDAPALLTALALGERHGFEERHWDGLRRTGTSHLVAISGLHVGLVASLSFLLVRRLWLCLPGGVVHFDLAAATLASFLAAAVYSACAGFAVPTQRALLMLSMAYVAILSRRYVSMTAGLSAALLIILLWDPLTTLSASFWLSFAAVGLLWQIGQRRVVHGSSSQSALERLRSLTSAQWYICLGLAPFAVFFFGELSLIAPVVNSAAIPLFSFLLVPLTLLSTLMLFAGAVGELFLYFTGFLAQHVWWAIDGLSGWKWSAVTVSRGDWWRLGLAAAGVAFALPLLPLRRRYLSVFAILPMLASRPAGPEHDGVAVTVLDVGHGLAAVVRTREHTLIYDAGARYRSGFDTGREIVIPALRALNRTSLDVLMISHADADHAGGAEAIVASFPDTRALVGPDVGNLSAERCRRGETWEWDGVEFSILHPPEDYDSLGNDSSCVLRIATKSRAVLITGDIEEGAERALARSGENLRADVVVVPHHGSATSSTNALVHATRPSYAIVSAAHANRWNFPRPDVRARWEESGAQLVTTGEMGAVTVKLDGEGGLAVESRRHQHRRYWHARSPGTSG